MNTTYNYNELRGRIISKYGNQNNFADALNITKQRVSMVLNNKAFLTAPEIEKWCKALDIDIDYLSYYFFAH